MVKIRDLRRLTEGEERDGTLQTGMGAHRHRNELNGDLWTFGHLKQLMQLLPHRMGTTDRLVQHAFFHDREQERRVFPVENALQRISK
jgi:hypothetical protein